MNGERIRPTEEDGVDALRAHVVERALLARRRHGPRFDEAATLAMLADPDVVRFPTRLAFDERALLAGEFAWPRPLGERPSEGFELVVHPYFAGRWSVLPLLIAYHVVAINYLDVATNVEAELFGATLLGMDVDEYYAAVCALADSIPGAPRHDPDVEGRFRRSTCGDGCSNANGGAA